MESLQMESSESTDSKLKTGIYTYRGSLLNEPKEIRTTVHWGTFPFHTFHLRREFDNLACLTIWDKPLPKPRETQRDRWAKRPCVLRFRFFRDIVRSAMEHFGFVPSEELGLVFYMKMPKLSKIKQAERIHKPHQVRPDLDNLEKATLDAVYAEDAVVYLKTALKLWSLEPRIEIWNLK